MGRDHNGFRLAAASGVSRQPGVESRLAPKIKQGLQLLQPLQRQADWRLFHRAMVNSRDFLPTCRDLVGCGATWSPSCCGIWPARPWC